MADQETTLEADALRVVFFRRGDRFAHRVEVLDGTGRQWVAVLESLEGSPDEDWPPSPPFQQLHVEERPTGRVILLVGMAGRTHWSAAVEVAVDRRSICFDVAARVQHAPLHLGSEYRECREGEAPAEPCVDIKRRLPPAPSSIPATVAWQIEVSRRP